MAVFPPNYGSAEHPSDLHRCCGIILAIDKLNAQILVL